MGSKGDLANGARLNPELHRTLIEMEKESGFTFQAGRALSDILNEPSASGSLFDDENEACIDIQLAALKLQRFLLTHSRTLGIRNAVNGSRA